VGFALILLLDSSTLIWATSVPSLLSARARSALDDDQHDVCVSAASAWEIATKHRLGRLEHAGPLVDDWDGHLERFGYTAVDITDRQARHAGSYPVAHGDPFDRIIAAQADLEEMTLVASDRAFDLFPVTRLW